MTDTVCTVCQRHKAQLKPKKSQLNPSMTMFLCNECAAAKREPRFLVILMARAEGIESVRDYIRNHRYVGDEIIAEELIN